ncbi:MAG TPA: ABC-F family ATP-binding cassette domain-containing protein [Ilumatobacteraceae bacterium]|nr:ABC-F family ATP-binding cassette domain-containing protein [Ilumatobacteraceae bacterium]
MAASLIARQLTVVRGPLLVLDSIDLTLAPRHRVGLVGPNGVGKSTLLAALAGRIPLDAGSVELAPRQANVGWLPQEPDRSTTETVRDFLGRRSGVGAAQRALDDATIGMSERAAGADDAYSDALERWLALGAPDFEARVGETWAELGLDPALLDQPTATLSGGEAARCSLASLLLSRFDVFLLDEPTNDLDLDGLARLERWVNGIDAPVLLVSHDRTFLERVVTDVVEIDHHSHQATWFSGGWSAFGAERERARQLARERFEEFDTQRTVLKQRAQREREWASQGQSKVRRSDENDKHIRHFKMNQTEQLAGRAARTQKAAERLEVVEEPREPWELRLTIPTVGRSGDVVATARGAVVERQSFRLGPVDLDIRVGDRIALVGANGSGKTTLISLLLGRVEPSAGTARLGASVVVGEIEQARTRLVGDDTLLDAFTAATGLVPADARTLLAKFGLVADHVHRRAGTLSPGERTRASLALLMANGANLLVLDEPTNHLDLPAIEQLEQALDTFAGTVLLVTHDRSLLERVRLTRTLDVSDGTVTERR